MFIRGRGRGMPPGARSSYRGRGDGRGGRGESGRLGGGGPPVRFLERGASLGSESRTSEGGRGGGGSGRRGGRGREAGAGRGPGRGGISSAGRSERPSPVAAA